MGMRSSASRGAIMGAALAWIASGAPAFADNFGGPKNSAPHGCNDSPAYSQCVAEDEYHQINFASSLDSAYVDAMYFNEGHFEDGLNGVLTYFYMPYGSDNDVRVNDGDFGNNNHFAWTRCASTLIDSGDNGTSPDGYDMKWCKPQLIFFNDHYSHGPNDLKAIACHELGHTLGLRHKGQSSGTTSCMRDDPTIDLDESPAGPLTLPNSHDIQYHLSYEF